MIDIRSYFRNLRQDVRSIKYGGEQQWATQKLQGLLSGPQFIPQTGWSMTPRAIVHALNIVSLMACKNIIEFGSGATTIYLAALLKSENREDFHFYSVESDLRWKKTIEAQLKNQGLEDYVTIIHAPLQPVPQNLAYKNQERWYDSEVLLCEIEPDINFDFIVVDGPFGGSTPFARSSAYPFLKNKTAETAIWMLDDSNREQEQEIIKHWAESSGLSYRSFARYAILSPELDFDLTPYNMQ